MEENRSLVEEYKKDEYRPWGVEMKQFIMFMHLSQFASMVIPMGGIILPLVMWLTNKDQSALVDENGKNIVNWSISFVIYMIISFMLFFVFVGIFLMIGLVICSIIFAIKGAVKASNGEVYNYPMTITFIS